MDPTTSFQNEFRKKIKLENKKIEKENFASRKFFLKLFPTLLIDSTWDEFRKKKILMDVECHEHHPCCYW